MTIRIEKAEADQGQYTYCFTCGGLVSARFSQGIVLRAPAILEVSTLVTLPEFCTCAETPEAQIQRALWKGSIPIAVGGE